MIHTAILWGQISSVSGSSCLRCSLVNILFIIKAEVMYCWGSSPISTHLHVFKGSNYNCNFKKRASKLPTKEKGHSMGRKRRTDMASGTATTDTPLLFLWCCGSAGSWTGSGFLAFHQRLWASSWAAESRGSERKGEGTRKESGLKFKCKSVLFGNVVFSFLRIF